MILNYRQLNILLLLITMFVLFSCEMEPSSLGDSRFYGSFIGRTGGSSTPALGLSNYSWLYISFDGTNRVWMSVSRDSYGVEVYRHQGYAEWQISGNKYRYRSWDDKNASWSIWAEFEFISSNQLRIQWDPRYDSQSNLKWVTLTDY